MSPSRTRIEISKCLKNELDKAHADYSAACKRFDSLIKATAAGIAPKGNLRLRKAGNDSVAALQKYIEALTRYTDFAVSGTAPENPLPRKQIDAGER